MKKFIWAIALVFVILATGIFIGWMMNKTGKPATSISSESILTALHERGFLVTQTSVMNESVKISTESSSIWQKILWGQSIQASGVVEVNMGVDLAKTVAGDVVVYGNKVTVTIPPAQIFNSRLVGDINVENTQGILKRLFESDDGYNQAMAELIKTAENVSTSTDMMDTANAKAKEEIQRLVGYIAKDKTVEVDISK